MREYSPSELLKATKIAFNKVEIYGVFGSEKITEIEINRLRQYRSISGYSKQISKSLIKTLLKTIGSNGFVFRKIHKNKTDNHYCNKDLLSIARSSWDTFKVEDYRLSNKSINKSLDLFFILTKGGD